MEYYRVYTDNDKEFIIYGNRVVVDGSNPEYIKVDTVYDLNFNILDSKADKVHYKSAFKIPRPIIECVIQYSVGDTVWFVGNEGKILSGSVQTYSIIGTKYTGRSILYSIECDNKTEVLPMGSLFGSKEETLNHLRSINL